MAQAFSPRFCYQPGHGGNQVPSFDHRVETGKGSKEGKSNGAEFLTSGHLAQFNRNSRVEEIAPQLRSWCCEKPSPDATALRQSC